MAPYFHQLRCIHSWLFLLQLSLPVRSWLPVRDGGIIRGVNLGGLFIIEPWMMSREWRDMGCSGTSSEAECVSKLGQEAADDVFDQHWESWITEDDFKEMTSYDLNSIRIPLGFWMKEDLVYSNETFPRGAFQYLEKVVQWATDYNMYTILDLHAAPGAQVAMTPSTGQMANEPQFYNTANYERAYAFIEWMVNIIHTNPSFRAVGAIELVNEPVQGQWNYTSTLISEYYPQCWTVIQNLEAKLSVVASRRLNIMMMSAEWGAGDPTPELSLHFNMSLALLDDHRFVKFDPGIQKTREAYMVDACRPTRRTALDDNLALVTGEWSISPADSVQASSEFTSKDRGWYLRWFLAQMQQYERESTGWLFWTWKISLNDYRWGYQAAVKAGVIPRNLTFARQIKPCFGNVTQGLVINGASKFGISVWSYLVWSLVLSIGWNSIDL